MHRVADDVEYATFELTLQSLAAVAQLVSLYEFIHLLLQFPEND